jgi:hypothetical protein
MHPNGHMLTMECQQFEKWHKYTRLLLEVMRCTGVFLPTTGRLDKKANMGSLSNHSIDCITTNKYMAPSILIEAMTGSLGRNQHVKPIRTLSITISSNYIRTVVKP